MIAQLTAKNGVRMSSGKTTFKIQINVFNLISNFQLTSLKIVLFSARAFIRPIIDRPNLHVMLNTTVTKVLVHPKAKNAYGVEVVDGDGHTMKILAKKEVIVSGGAVNSPQILMLSGIGPREELTRVSSFFFHIDTKIVLQIQKIHSLCNVDIFPFRLEFVRSSTCLVWAKIFTITSLSSPISISMTPILRL